MAPHTSTISKKGKHGGARKGAGKPSAAVRRQREASSLRAFQRAVQRNRGRASLQEESNATQEVRGNQETLDPRPPPPYPPPPSPPPSPPRNNADNLNEIPLSTLSSVHAHGRKLTGIVKDQIHQLSNVKTREKCIAAVKKGAFWERPKFIMSGDIIDLKTSWRHFFKLSVFNWFPLELMSNNWMPGCPNCKKRLLKHGFLTHHPARLIFGLRENYLLHAPQRLKCGACAVTRENELQSGVPKEKRTKSTWLTTDMDILTQIYGVYPSLEDAFPCILTHINGIDKGLMELVVEYPTKGLGPASLSDALVTFHERNWQRKENGWAIFVKQRLLNPTIRDLAINRNEIEKCPSYFSKEICGAIPSTSYLTHMFCKYIDSIRFYLDSEVLKRSRSSECASLDASYKIFKYLMKSGDAGKAYDTLHTVSNEYNEIIGQKWSNGDSHQEIIPNLQQLRDLGLQPKLVYTDVPERDRAMLEHVFPQLLEGVDRNAFHKARQDALACGLQNVPMRGSTVYLYSFENAIAALHVLTESISNTSDPNDKLIALDCEWPVYFQPNQQTSGKVSILQLATPVLNDAYIFELYSLETSMVQFGVHLRRLFSISDVSFLGCNHKSDITLLRSDWPQLNLPDISCERIIDIRDVALSRGITKRGLGNNSLEALSAKAGYYLPKDNEIRVGSRFDCRNGSLKNDTEALKYCHLDVEMPILLYKLWRNMPVLTDRIEKKDLTIGMIVDLMSASKEIIEPIAVGKVVKINGTSTCGINLNKGIVNRCEVKILQVYNPNGVIHFPRKEDRTNCACQRFEHGTISAKCNMYCFGALGDPPFRIVEVSSRLRCSTTEILNDDDNEESSKESEPLIEENPLNESTHDSISNNNSNEDEENDDLLEDIEGSEEFEDDLQNSQGIIAKDHMTILDKMHLPTNIEDELNHQAEEVLQCDDEVDFNELLELNDDENEDNDLDEWVSLDQLSPLAVKLVDATDPSSIIEAADSYIKEYYYSSFDSDEQEKRYPILTKVLGDPFHVMDRVKVPMHHDFKIAYFRSLRAAIFILHPEDVTALKTVLNITSAKEWNRVLAFNFKYIAKRVRRKIPPPDLLYLRIKRTFDFFANQKDSKTGKPLFNEEAKRKAKLVLELVKSGYLSDPHGYCLYTKQIDMHGQPKKDKHGLQLYRSVRGTSSLESLHRILSNNFGHTYAGPHYSDCLLALIRHNRNWRASIEHRPDFPKLRHYDGLAIDRINDLYVEIFGEPKYRNWVHTNDALPPSPHVSLFGITPIISEYNKETQSHTAFIPGRNGKDFLASRQGSNIAFLPVANSKHENTLYAEFMQDALRTGSSLGRLRTFEDMAKKWNQRARGKVNNIYKKLPIHLVRHYKEWRKRKSRKEATNTPECNALLNALEHVVTMDSNIDPLVSDTREPRPLSFSRVASTLTNDTTTATTSTTTDQRGAAASSSGNVQIHFLKRTSKRCGSAECKKDISLWQACKGGYDRKLCRLIPSNLRVKRKVLNKRVCQVCLEGDCPGHNKRSRCPKYVADEE